MSADSTNRRERDSLLAGAVGMNSPLEAAGKVGSPGKSGSPSGDSATIGSDPGAAHHSLTTNGQTMMHLLKGNIGTGVLAMPSAFRNAGLVVGTVGVVLIGVTCIHCMHMLLRCNRVLSRRKGVRTLDFAGVTSEAVSSGPYALRSYSRVAGKMINGFLILTQIGFCCVYFLFVATSLQKVMNVWVSESSNPSVQVYLAILLPVMILYNFIRSLRTLALASTVANVLQIGGMVLIFYKIFEDGLQNVFSVSWAKSIQTFPLFFGTAIYAFEGIGIVLPLENEMRTPEDFGGLFGVMNTGMSLVVVLYTAMGLFGYLCYGDDSLGSITLNFSPGWLSESVRSIFAVSIFFSYGLQMYVPMQIFWPWLCARYQLEAGRSERELWMVEMAVRAAFVFFTFLLALSIPELDLFISLVGSFASSSLALIIPPLIELLTFYDDDEVPRKQYAGLVAKDLLIMMCGVSGFLTGTIINLNKVYQCLISSCPTDG